MPWVFTSFRWPCTSGQPPSNPETQENQHGRRTNIPETPPADTPEASAEAPGTPSAEDLDAVAAETPAEAPADAPEPDDDDSEDDTEDEDDGEEVSAA